MQSYHPTLFISAAFLYTGPSFIPYTRVHAFTLLMRDSALLVLPFWNFCLWRLLCSLDIMIDYFIVRMMLIFAKLQSNLNTLLSSESAFLQSPRAPRKIGMTSTALTSPNSVMSPGGRTLYYCTFSSAAPRWQLLPCKLWNPAWAVEFHVSNRILGGSWNYQAADDQPEN